MSHRNHHLSFGFAVPQAKKTSEGWRLEWADTAVMGIVNVTPDSFSDGGKHLKVEAAIASALKMQEMGALFVDIGGESTRPRAEPVAAETELDRILPVIRGLAGSNAVISVDTMKPEVAFAALKAGAHLINDVTGLSNPEMVRVCAEAGAPACLMHMQGEPRSMQENPVYGKVVTEVKDYLLAGANTALAAGVPSVMIDVGLGFGKTLAHNLALLKALPELTAGPYPMLLGASRKRLIDWLAKVSNAADRDAGSLVLHLHAARSGVAVVRVHAVALHIQALRVQNALEYTE